MEFTALALVLVGAFYIFAGVVATRAALMSHVLDKALAGISGGRLTRVEKAQTAWHLIAASLVLAGGLTLVLRLDMARWLFLASALGQAAYIYAVAPLWFDAEDPPDPKGRRQTTNAFILYAAATAFVWWAAHRGDLQDWRQLDWPWLAAAVVAYLASVAHTLWQLAGPWSSSSAAPSFSAAHDRPASEAKQVKVWAARDHHPLWALDEDLYGDFAPADIGLSETLSRDLLEWNAAYTRMLVAADASDRDLDETELSAHAAEGRRLAVRLAAERPDLEVYVDEPEAGVVQVLPDT